MARITKREQFAKAIDVLVAADELELAKFIQGEIDLITKRANAPRKLTKDQLANEVVKENIVTILETGEALRAGEIAKALDITVQKATALLTQLVKTDAVKRVEGEKGVIIFTV